MKRYTVPGPTRMPAGGLGEDTAAAGIYSLQQHDAPPR